MSKSAPYAASLSMCMRTHDKMVNAVKSLTVGGLKYVIAYIESKEKADDVLLIKLGYAKEELARRQTQTQARLDCARQDATRYLLELETRARELVDNLARRRHELGTEAGTLADNARSVTWAVNDVQDFNMNTKLVQGMETYANLVSATKDALNGSDS